MGTDSNDHLLYSIWNYLLEVSLLGRYDRYIPFYELLKYLNTPNLMFSTVSIVTSFLAATLTMLRSSYYALGYASNDIVLIILWVMASIKDPSYFPVVVNFMIFFLNDMYGFISWKKREAKIEEKIEIG